MLLLIIILISDDFSFVFCRHFYCYLFALLLLRFIFVRFARMWAFCLLRFEKPELAINKIANVVNKHEMLFNISKMTKTTNTPVTRETCYNISKAKTDNHSHNWDNIYFIEREAWSSRIHHLLSMDRIYSLDSLSFKLPIQNTYKKHTNIARCYFVCLRCKVSSFERSIHLSPLTIHHRQRLICAWKSNENEQTQIEMENENGQTCLPSLTNSSDPCVTFRFIFRFQFVMTLIFSTIWNRKAVLYSNKWKSTWFAVNAQDLYVYQSRLNELGVDFLENGS